MAPSLIKKVLGASNTDESSTTSPTSSTSKSTSTFTPKTNTKAKPKTISSDNNHTKTQTLTSTPTTKTKTTVTRTRTRRTEGGKKSVMEGKVEIVGPGSDPMKNQIWGSNEVPRMGRGMVPAIVGEQQLTQEELARMGVKPQGRWVKVDSTKTVTKIEGKRVIERTGGDEMGSEDLKDESKPKPKTKDDEMSKGEGAAKGKGKEK